MCGIAGIINKKGINTNQKDIQRMNDVMAHRGPDAEGVYIEGNLGFGHRRLSIVDLAESGNQPMVSYDGKYVLVFNGEIYNYIELKKQLEKKGALFSTETDTEVIIEAFRFWGVNCTKRFNGMWSLAIYDRDKRQIFISRDRFGVKPLYICETEDEFIFASEIKCITTIRPEQKKVNIVQVARYLEGYQEDLDEQTFFVNIYNFPKCHNMIYCLDTYTQEYQKYWEINVPKFKKKWKSNNPDKRFLELLEDSIKIRLRADVKVGASLSGGLDSSTIVGIISKKFHVKIHTFSSIYKEKECNEKEYIDYMNQYADTKPHHIYPDKSEDIIKDMKDLIYYHDGPCHCASPYSGFYVYRGVGDHVKVLLDGQGADELFGGYLFFYNAKIKEVLKKNTWISKIKAIYLILIFQIMWPEQINILDGEIIRRTLGTKGYSFVKKRIEKQNIQVQQSRKIKYQKEFAKIDLNIKMIPDNTIISELDKVLNLQLQYSMLPRILHDVDRNSMASSLEVRLPFLDYRLVEFSYTLSDRDKIYGSWTKYIMRKNCRKYLPKKIYRRRDKMGFPAPVDKWLRDERYKDEMKSYLNAFKQRNIADSHSLERCYQEHLSKKKNWGDQLLRFIMLEIWLQSEIDTIERKWIYEAR